MSIIFNVLGTCIILLTSINFMQCLESWQSRIAKQVGARVWVRFKGGIGGFEDCSFLSLGWRSRTNGFAR